jgi:hypothetical protein
MTTQRTLERAAKIMSADKFTEAMTLRAAIDLKPLPSEPMFPWLADFFHKLFDPKGRTKAQSKADFERYRMLSHLEHRASIVDHGNNPSAPGLIQPRSAQRYFRNGFWMALDAGLITATIREEPRDDDEVISAVFGHIFADNIKITEAGRAQLANLRDCAECGEKLAEHPEKLCYACWGRRYDPNW